MTISRLTSLFLFVALAGLGVWSVLPWGTLDRRYDGITLALVCLYVLVLLAVNVLARDYERALVALVVILNVMWILVRVVAYLLLDPSLKFDDYYYASVGDINVTLLYLILGVVVTAFGIRIGSCVWLALPDRNRATQSNDVVERPPFKVRDLLLFGYVVVGFQVVFSYLFRLSLTTIGGIPDWAEWVITLLNLDMTLLWLFAYAVWYWPAMARRERIHVYVFFAAVIAVYLSKNFLAQLTILFVIALLSRHDDPIVSRRMMLGFGLSAALFVPLYVGGYDIARVEKAEGIAGQRLGLTTTIEGLKLYVQGDSETAFYANRAAVFQLGARFDDMVLLLNVEPRSEYLGLWYAVKRTVNVALPRVRLFPDARMPQSLLFKVDYDIAPLESAMVFYNSDALPALGVYYRYFGGEVGALTALFVTSVAASLCYRKTVSMTGFVARVLRIYCVYYFGQVLFGMGVDTAVSMFVYSGVWTGLAMAIILKAMRLLRHARASLRMAGA